MFILLCSLVFVSSNYPHPVLCVTFILPPPHSVAFFALQEEQVCFSSENIGFACTEYQARVVSLCISSLPDSPPPPPPPPPCCPFLLTLAFLPHFENNFHLPGVMTSQCGTTTVLTATEERPVQNKSRRLLILPVTVMLAPRSGMCYVLWPGCGKKHSVHVKRWRAATPLPPTPL